MKKIWQLFVGDLKRLRSNVVTGIIVLGLIALPSIFSWYNMIAAWDVFGNTGNLKIAVASVDEGYESDLVPVKINVGEQVISALRANNQIKWVFTDKEDAIDGAKSGKYYAAVVIPESFSRDMMTFLFRRCQARENHLLLQREEERHFAKGDRPRRRCHFGAGEPGVRKKRFPIQL